MSVAMDLCGTVVGGIGADIGEGDAEDVGVRGRERCAGSRVDAEGGTRVDGVSVYSCEDGRVHVDVGVDMVARVDVVRFLVDGRVDVVGSVRVGMDDSAVHRAGGAGAAAAAALHRAGGAGAGAAAAPDPVQLADDPGDERAVVRGR